MAKVILGIDPGNARCGWGVVQEEGGELAMLACGCVETPKEEIAGNRLLSVYEQICTILKEYHPRALSMEKLFFSRNVTSAMAVAEARGVVPLAAAQAQVPVYEYTPSEIKETMTGNGQAKKKEVEAAVVYTLNLDKAPKPDDTADAVAIAITHIFWEDFNGGCGNDCVY